MLAVVGTVLGAAFVFLGIVITRPQSPFFRGRDKLDSLLVSIAVGGVCLILSLWTFMLQPEPIFLYYFLVFSLALLLVGCLFWVTWQATRLSKEVEGWD